MLYCTYMLSTIIMVLHIYMHFTSKCIVWQEVLPPCEGSVTPAGLPRPGGTRLKRRLNSPLCPCQRTSTKVGAEVARLNDRHLNAKRSHFLSQCLRQPFDGKLTGIVDAQAHGPGEATNR